jgi:nicotinate-nucleotide pyrophosphorylase (carboxylating)
MSRHRAEHVGGSWTDETLVALEAAGLDPLWVRDLVARVLEEDLGPRGEDVTTCATVPAEQERTGRVVARAAGVVAGMPLLPAILAGTADLLDLPMPSVEPQVTDGAEVAPGQVLAVLHGRTRVLLVAERAMLNLLCRLSGVATHTRAWVLALAGTGVQVLDTRKTTPGLRPLEKYAVRCGGGTNKRMGLFDVAMIKDNHKVAAGSIKAAYDAVQQTYPDVEIQVEVETPVEAEEAVLAGARFLLCDNMSVALLAETVQHARAVVPDPIELEATGGLTLSQASAYATAGVDYLSVGALTHSSPVLDVALDVLPPDQD